MSYLLRNQALVAEFTLGHIQMTLIALAVATAVALPLGTMAARYRRIGVAVTGALGMLYTIPSLALMILLIGPLGLNRVNVVTALIFYSQIILVRNVVAGFEGVDPAVREAARGMGMSAVQLWARVDLPLAAPVIIGGIRIAAVVSIAIATIGAKFNAGGLGTLLFDGIAQDRYDKIVAGSIAVSVLALAVNFALLALERRLDPRQRRAPEHDPAWGL